MLFLLRPKIMLAVFGVAFGAFITGTLLNRYTSLAYDPALQLSYVVWVGGAILLWIARKMKNRSKNNRED